MKLKLTKQQRADLFAGKTPHIRGNGECPIGPGYVYVISKDFHLCITKVEKDRGDWWLKYRVEDHRHKARNLLSTPAGGIDYDKVREAHAPENFRWDQLPEVDGPDDGTGLGSSYTTSAIGLVPEAGEAPDPEFVDRLAKAAQEPNTQLRERRKSDRATDLAHRIAAAKALVANHDPGDDPELKSQQRKVLRVLGGEESSPIREAA